MAKRRKRKRVYAKKRTYPMARRRYSRARTRTRYVTRYARSRASRSGLKGAVKPIVAGVATGMIQNFVPDQFDSFVPLGVGYFMNDKTLMTIGGYQLGIKLAQGGFGGLFGGSSGGGGGY